MNQRRDRSYKIVFVNRVFELDSMLASFPASSCGLCLFPYEPAPVIAGAEASRCFHPTLQHNPVLSLHQLRKAEADLSRVTDRSVSWELLLGVFDDSYFPLFRLAEVPTIRLPLT